jgi:hypothetical protein
MKAIYRAAKEELINKGIDFSKNVYSLSDSENHLLEQTANKYGYKISKCGNSCVGGILHCRFYELLRKIK